MTRHGCGQFHFLIYFVVLAPRGFGACAVGLPAPPEGYTPPGKLSMLFDLFAWKADCVNDCVQVVSFARHDDPLFAVACAAFISITIYLQLQRSHCCPWMEAHTSVMQGMVTPGWLGFRLAEQNIEAPGTGVVAPYGMALRDDLGLTAMISALLGIGFSVFAMSCGQLGGGECGKASHYGAVRAVEPWRLRMVHAWYGVVFTCELSCFALACCVLHPIIVLPFFLLNVGVNVRMHNFLWNGDNIQFSKNLDKFPMVLVLGRPPRTLLGIKCDRDIGKLGQRFYIFCASLLRITAWVLLMFWVKLPHGVSGFKHMPSLGRQMGSSVLRLGFLLPAHEFFDSLWPCLQALLKHPTDASISLHCRVPHSESLSTYATVYRSALVALAVFSTPIYLIGTALLLSLSSSIRNDDVEQDQDFNDQIRKKHEQVKKWCENRKQLTTYALVRSL